MTDLNQAYKDRIASVFSQGAGGYDQIGPLIFNHFGRSLVDQVGIWEGAHVLDIACGRGSVLFPTSEKVGPTGRVVGIDLAEGMVNETRQEIQRRGLKNLDIRIMDAEKLQFPANQFDVVICGFAVFFFPQLDRALAEIYRVLKQGGIFSISTFGDSDARWDSIRDLSESYYERHKPQPQVETKRLKSRAEITDTLAAAGFDLIEINQETRDFYYKDAEEWWATLWTHGFRSFLELMDEGTLAAYKKESLALVDQIKSPDGILETFQVFLTRAVRP